jgi:hypothetical protein
MAGKGGATIGAGRKSKDEEKRIRDLTSPYAPGAIDCVIAIMKDINEKASDRIAAAKLIIAYAYGNPTSLIDHTTQGEKIQNIINLGIGINPNTDEVQNIEN